MFLIGLTYNPRSSVAYLYGTEFLLQKDKLKYGAYNFTICGIIQCLTALWFRETKNQDSYFVIMIIMMSAAILWIKFCVPESPLFLLEV